MRLKFGSTVGLLAIALTSSFAGCGDDDERDEARKAIDQGAKPSEEERAGRAVEDWASAVRTRDSQRACELTYAPRQSMRECIAELERSQEFGEDVRFVARRVEILSGNVASVDTKILDGASPPKTFRFEVRRVADQWKFVVPTG